MPAAGPTRRLLLLYAVGDYFDELPIHNDGTTSTKSKTTTTTLCDYCRVMKRLVQASTKHAGDGQVHGFGDVRWDSAVQPQCRAIRTLQNQAMGNAGMLQWDENAFSR